MIEKPVKPIPTAGSWIQNTSERAILHVSEVDTVKERIRIKRFARYGKEGPEFDGRTTWLSYETYRRGTRYMSREAPVNPDNLPERITRSQAQEALEAEGWLTETASGALDNAADRIEYSVLTDRERAILRAYLGKPSPAVTPPDGMPVTIPETLTREQAERRLRLIEPRFSDSEIEDLLDSPREVIADASPEKDIPPQARETSREVLAILRAYVRGLDAKIASLSVAKIVNLIDGPAPNDVPAAQPTIADVLAAIEALRAEVRADRKPLLDAVDRVLAADSTWVDTTHTGISKALDDLRAARAKV
jgi:hypothetical protein